MDKQSYAKWADILKTLGHPVRIRIIECLADTQTCVNVIWGNLNLPQSTVSQHLSVLRSKGIVQHERCGANVKYFLKDRRIAEILKLMKSR